MTPAAIARSPSNQRQSQMTLGMAQLAPCGISEDWWLKYLGDVHWQLIAEAVGQNTTVFRDVHGRQLYAAFCATEFKQRQPELVGLGRKLDVRSELWAVGRSRIQSNHSLLANGVEVARFKLVSTFVAHMEAGNNASVRRAKPYLIPVLEPAPDCFAQEASVLAKQYRNNPQPGADYVRLPTHIGMDFNAVGLLYFPSFTRLFEHAEAATSPAFKWRPVKHRQILYFGNIAPGEPVLGSAPNGNLDGFTIWHSKENTLFRGLLAHCDVLRF